MMNQCERNYRKVEAMYHAGRNTDEIATACGMIKIETLDIVQLIYFKQKKER